MVWTGSVCFWNGSDYTRPDLCVIVTLRAHVLVIVRVVNELSPRCRSCQSVNKIPKSKIHNPTSPLLLFANLHTLKRLSADNPSRPPLSFFSPSSFAFLAISCFLSFSSSTYLSHTLRTSEVKQWKLQQTLRLRAPRTCRNNK